MAPSPYFAHGYLSAGPLLSFGGAGGFSISDADDDSGGSALEGDASPQLTRGVHVAAYLVANRHVHVGAFFDRLDSRLKIEPDDGDDEIVDGAQFNWGLALKAGGAAGRAFIAFALDAGMASLAVAGEEPVQRGLYLHPRLHLDVLAARDTPLKLALYVGVGPAISVTAGDYDVDGDLVVTRWWVSPALTLGGSLGG